MESSIIDTNTVQVIPHVITGDGGIRDDDNKDPRIPTFRVFIVRCFRAFEDKVDGVVTLLLVSF